MSATVRVRLRSRWSGFATTCAWPTTRRCRPRSTAATRRSRSTSTRPDEGGDWRPGAASDAWRHRSLAALDAALRQRGSHLRYFFGPSLATLQSLIADHRRRGGVLEPPLRTGVRTPRRPHQAARCARQGVRAESFNGALLFEPWTLRTQAGRAVQGVHAVLAGGAGALAAGAVRRRARRDCPTAREGPDGVPLRRVAAGARTRLGSRLLGRRGRPAKRAPLPTLDDLHRRCAARLREQRDRPDRIGTSRLSPHLHFGEIAPWRVVAALERAARRRHRRRHRRAPARAGLARVRPPPAASLSRHARPQLRPALQRLRVGAVSAVAHSRPGSRAHRRAASSTPACASCGPPAGCTTACA